MLFFGKRVLREFMDDVKIDESAFTKGKIEDCVDFFNGKMLHFVWNTIAVMEDLTATRQQTLDAISTDDLASLGKNDEGVSYEIQIKAFQDGARLLGSMVVDRRFDLSFGTMSKIHKFVGMEVDLEKPGMAGMLRENEVSVGVDYAPPNADELPKLCKKAFAELNGINNPVKRAVSSFMILSKLQLFCNANKRTSMMVMNGILMSNGFYPIFVPKKYKDNFNSSLKRLYNHAETGPMCSLFSSIAKRIAPACLENENSENESGIVARAKARRSMGPRL